MENKKPSVIKRSSDFTIIKEDGYRKNLSQWLLLSFKKNSFGTWRFGTTVSKKVGSAVVRNKLKRWVRAYFQIHFGKLFDKLIEEQIKHSDKIESTDDNLNFIACYDLNFVFRPMPEGFYKNLTYQEFVKTLDDGLVSLEKTHKKKK